MILLRVGPIALAETEVMSQLSPPVPPVNVVRNSIEAISDTSMTLGKLTSNPRNVLFPHDRPLFTFSSHCTFPSRKWMPTLRLSFPPRRSSSPVVTVKESFQAITPPCCPFG